MLRRPCARSIPSTLVRILRSASAGTALIACAACSPNDTVAPQYGGLSGRLLDSLGTPQAGETVWAQTLRAHGGYHATASTTTGVDGRFAFESLERTDWVVTASTGVLAAAIIRRAPASGLELTYRRACAVRGRATLRGGGAPASTVVMSEAPPAVTGTGPDGSFLLGGMPPGSWWVVFSNPFVTSDTAVAVTLASPGDTVDVGDVELTPVP